MNILVIVEVKIFILISCLYRFPLFPSTMLISVPIMVNNLDDIVQYSLNTCVCGVRS